MTDKAIAPLPRAGLAEIAARYDVILCDIWGVVHNGVAPWGEACEALARFRAGGGAVLLVSNAPRPSLYVVPQLDELGVPREAWSGFVSSGDVAVHELRRRGVRRMHHIGPERDLGIFEGLPAALTGVGQAEIAVVTGLEDDEAETPDDYRERLEEVRAHGLDLVCANPDRVVERGDRLVWCAGALADLYAEMGGEVLFTGKPHAPVYEAALSIAASIRRARVDRGRVLAIGDSVRTDLAGANGLGVDCLFVTSGIHAEELGDPVSPAILRELIDGAERPPVAWAERLYWA